MILPFSFGWGAILAEIFVFEGAMTAGLFPVSVPRLEAFARLLRRI